MTTTAADRFFSVEFHMGSESDPAVRLARAEQRLAEAKSAVADGWFVVETPAGVSLLNPGHFARSFRAMKWMSSQDIAAARRLPDMAVGETVVLARDYHPRHGVKRRPTTRIA